MLPLADAFAQDFLLIATLWIFSMGAADAGALLFSPSPGAILQPHHCRIKDWRYSQAVSILVCDVLWFLIFQGAMCCDDGEGWEREDVLR